MPRGAPSNFDPPTPTDDDFEGPETMADTTKAATGPVQQIDPAMAQHPDVVAIRDFLVQTGAVVLTTTAQEQAAANYEEGYRVGFSAGQASAARADGTPAASGGVSEPTGDTGTAESPSEPSEAAGDAPAASLEQVIGEWWETKAHDEVQPLLAKMTEYGGVGRAEDLVAIGRQMAALQGREVDDAEATELGIFFYVTGKMGRWQTAVRDAFPVSDDTLLDIGVYVRMAQRAREVGGWPV